MFEGKPAKRSSRGKSFIGILGFDCFRDLIVSKGVRAHQYIGVATATAMATRRVWGRVGGMWSRVVSFRVKKIGEVRMLEVREGRRPE